MNRLFFYMDNRGVFCQKVNRDLLTMQRRGQIYVIAEMACSHEGSSILARKIVDGAGRAGANAIQFQIWSLVDMVVPHHPEYEKLVKIELPQEEWRKLAAYVREQYPSMDIIACIYERRSVDFCESIQVDAYKIHSADLSNPYLVKYVAGTGKRIDLSIGASTLDEIQNAIQWIREASSSAIWFMYGYQDFPTRTDDVHLRYMMNLKHLFGLPIGYQDHTDANTGGAFWLPAASIGMGVDILEKHITHDRSYKGIDHEAALNPDEFARFMAMVREIETAQGVSQPKPFSPSEMKYRRDAKKSVVAGRDLPRGILILREDLRFMRAVQLGLPPDRADRLIGRTLKRDIKVYDLILEEDVQ